MDQGSRGGFRRQRDGCQRPWSFAEPYPMSPGDIDRCLIFILSFSLRPCSSTSSTLGCTGNQLSCSSARYACHLGKHHIRRQPPHEQKCINRGVTTRPSLGFLSRFRQTNREPSMGANAADRCGGFRRLARPAFAGRCRRAAAISAATTYSATPRNIRRSHIKIHSLVRL